MEKFRPEKGHSAGEAEVREQVPGRVEKLPGLELREVLRSDEPINLEDGLTSDIEELRPWNNYTIVTLDGSERIKIFNEDAHKVEGFELPFSSKAVEVKWRNLRRLKKTANYISPDNNVKGPNDIRFSELPTTIRSFAERFRLKSNISHISLGIDSTGGYPASIFEMSRIEVTSDNKYVVLYDGRGGYFAFLTQNEQGVALAPKDWTRIDASYKGEVPEDLENFAEGLNKNSEGYKSLTEKYAALITDVGINIVESDNLDNSLVFSATTPSVEANITVDPSNPNIIFYCQSSNPSSIMRLDLEGEPGSWSPVAAELPNKYDAVRNLQLDPSGNFFLFYSSEDLVIITKDSLEEVKRVPGLGHVNFDATGRIRAVDKDGHLVIYEANFGELTQEIDAERITRLAEGLQIQDIFDLQASEKKGKGERGLEHLEPIRTKYQEQFGEVLSEVTNREGVAQVRQGLNKLRDTLRQQGLKPDETEFIIKGLEEPIIEKEKEFALKETREVLDSVRTKLDGSLSITSIAEARAEIDSIRAVEALLETNLRQEFRAMAQELEQRSVEFFHQRGSEVIKDVQGLLERTKADLEGFTSKSQMDDWLEFRYPQLKSRLGSLAHEVPLEADEAYKAIVGARTELQELATQFEENFKREYAKVREKAVERMEGTIDVLESDIEGLIDRLRSKGFADRQSAEQYLDSSEARRTLESEIAALAGNDPDVAKELRRALRIRVSNALTEIERGGMTQIAETGQQMILIGDTHFPKWEAKVKEKVDRRVDIVFNEDEKTHGPGVKAGDILGDIAVNIRTSTGKTDNVRLYEGWRDENEWRLGLLSYRGEAIPPSYVTASEYAKIKREYTDWVKGEQSQLQKDLQEKREALKEIYSRRQKIGERTPAVDEKWKEEFQEALSEYSGFVAENHIALFKRIDQISSEPEIEYTNGRGFVPEWQSHWVNDPETAKGLEEMAKIFKMQMDLQEGILNLRGHAGAGKDVRVKMFCALTNRPYFSIDGTKWTTEFELSEDVMLESKEGASQTIKVPSAVLNGISTPGSVVYFNEFNAMPEQAQIFLHALMDEKRSLTLKTSSGKVVRAHPSVLLASSMNPGYPGTFDPQFATRSRMVSLEVDYPPLTREPGEGDNNPNDPYDTSEALRIAREVDSLSDLTYEASLERNEFVQMWDKYVNGIENGAPDPNSTQKFDMDVSLALVQFATKLREDFIKIFERSRDARNALPVSQPITGRELRRCAYELSKMIPEDKTTANPEAVARDLLDKYFLTHIDKKEDQDRIRTAMNTWTSQKRVRT